MMYAKILIKLRSGGTLSSLLRYSILVLHVMNDKMTIVCSPNAILEPKVEHMTLP